MARKPAHGALTIYTTLAFCRIEFLANGGVAFPNEDAHSL